MHGSSSVPQELQDVFNAHGGEMPQTWGVPLEEIERGIKHGVRKVNIDTDCRLAMLGVIRKIANENKSEFDPRKFLNQLWMLWNNYVPTGLGDLARLVMLRVSSRYRCWQ